jgi:hypothetical protein
MKKFVAESRTVHDLNLELVVSGVNRLPRKIKKKVKSMAKRVSSVEMLNYLIEIKD